MKLTVAGTGTGSVVDALLPNPPTLRLMVVTSVMTWARDVDQKKYGWWATALNTDAEKEFGSFLWKLARSKARAETSSAIVTYVTTSLDWMKRRGIVEDIYVQASALTEAGWLRVRLVRGERSVEVFFDNLWTGVD